MDKALGTLLRLRQLAVDQAQSRLAEANRDQAAAEAARNAQAAVLVKEIGQSHQDQTFLLATGNAWLAAARDHHRAKAAEVVDRGHDVDTTRAQLADQQAQLKAVRAVAAEKAAAAAKKRSRDDQRRMDEQAVVKTT